MELFVKAHFWAHLFSIVLIVLQACLAAYQNHQIKPGQIMRLVCAIAIGGWAYSLTFGA